MDDTDCGRSPLLAVYSESLTPTYPFKEVGLGRSPYQRTGQAVMFVCSCPNLAALRRTLRPLLGTYSTCVRPFLRRDPVFALRLSVQRPGLPCTSRSVVLNCGRHYPPTLARLRQLFFCLERNPRGKPVTLALQPHFRSADFKFFSKENPSFLGSEKLDGGGAMMGFVGKHSR